MGAFTLVKGSLQPLWKRPHTQGRATHTHTHTHTHTPQLSCDGCGHSILQGHGDWQGIWEGLDLERIPGISSVQSLRCVWLFATPWTAARQASLSITISWILVKLMSIELVMPSNHLMFCYPLLLPPSIFPSFRVFSNESVLLIRWPKYRSFSFSISPSNQYSGPISFSIDWFDLLAAQGTLKSQGWAQNLKAVLVWTQCGPVSIKLEAWWWGSLQFIAHTLIKLLWQSITQECSCQ